MKQKRKNSKKKRFTFEKRHVILAVVVLAVIAAIYVLETTQSSRITPQPAGTQSFNAEIGEMAPELAGISGYLNTDGEEIHISNLRGKVVLIDFWTYTCVNCIRTFPFLTAWDEKYRDDGLVIIGVHTPEFEFEKEYDNVQAAIDLYGIEYPVVQDNDYQTWQAFNNNYWPRKYIIDAEGRIQYDHIGEGAYEETELKIQELLAEIGNDVSDTTLTEEEPRERQTTTPELYAGYSFALGRGQNIGNPGGLYPGQSATYQLPTQINPHTIYLDGQWQSNADNLLLQSELGSLVIGFTSKEVNIVAAPIDKQAVRLDIFIDGQYITEEQAGSDVQFHDGSAFIIVREPRLYNIVQGDYGTHVLGIGTQEGFSFNAFTFG